MRTALRIVLSVCFMIVSVPSFAQAGPGSGDYSDNQTNLSFEAPNIMGASPSVSSLMRFEEIPVDGYSGVPGITIPLFQVNTLSPKVSLDLSLSYHVTGIAAEEVASFTGLGWSLLAGGTISREVRGLPDEYFTGSTGSPLGSPVRVGIYNRPPLEHELINYFELISTSPYSNEDYMRRYRWNAYEKNYFDLEYDLYQYNVMGMSGRFYIMMNENKELEVVKMDENPIQIELDYTGPAFDQNPIVEIKGFTLINTDGTKFVFEEGDREKIVYSSIQTNTTYFLDSTGEVNAAHPAPIDYPNAFQLSKVYDNNNDLLLSFSYQDVEEKIISHQVTENSANTDLESIIGRWQVDNPDPEWGNNIRRLEPERVITKLYTTTLTKKLNEINIPGYGRVELTYEGGRVDSQLPTDSGAKKLTKITLKDGEDNQIKAFSFEYDYFTSPYAPQNVFPQGGAAELKRLILKGIKEYGISTSEYLKYSLDYEPGHNPGNKTLTKDPWGYLTFEEVKGYESIEAKKYVTTGALKEIKLPTGGRVEYEFEPNTYSYKGDLMIEEDKFTANPENRNIDPSDSLYRLYLYGGGIRIKEIRTYLDNSEDIASTKRYDYRDYSFLPEEERRVSSGSLVFQIPKYEFSFSKNTGLVVGNDITRVISYESKTSTNNLSYLKSLGSDIGYQFITIYDVSTDNLSTSKGRIENIFRAPQEIPEVNEEGLPIEYDGYSISYPFVPFKNSDYLRGQLKESRIYDQGGRLLKEVKNEYVEHVEEIEEGEEGEEKTPIVGIKMAIESGSGCPWAWFYNNYAAYNIAYTNGGQRLCGPPSSHIQVHTIYDVKGWLKKESTTTTEYFYENGLTKEVETVQEFTYDPVNKQVKTQKTKGSLNENLETIFYYPQNLTESYEQQGLMNEMVERNQIGEAVIIQTKNNNTFTGEKKTIYEKFHNSSSQPGYILPEAVYLKKGKDSTVEDRKVTYKYNTKGQIIQYTLENGIDVSIVWGYNGQYPVAKVEGVAYSEIQSVADLLYNSSDLDESSCSTLKTAVQSASEDAMLTCYIYQPLTGMTRVIHPNGLNEFYDYDSFGRLKEIKDTEENVIRKMKYHYVNPQP